MNKTNLYAVLKINFLIFDTETQQVYTEFFDGPLELLLYLVRRQGVDIRHVKIAPITDAYLMHVRKMSLLKLDVAGDFLYLASTLCYLKSREMLPNATAPTEEETEDPLLIRERLAQQLIEYERFREASQILNQRDLLHRDVFTSPVPLETGPPSVNVNVDALGLLHIYRSILKQHQLPPPKHKVEKSTFSLIDMGERVACGR